MGTAASAITTVTRLELMLRGCKRRHHYCVHYITGQCGGENTFRIKCTVQAWCFTNKFFYPDTWYEYTMNPPLLLMRSYILAPKQTATVESAGDHLHMGAHSDCPG